MATTHTAAGVNETTRNVAVPPSPPYHIDQRNRATAAAVVVPPARTSPGAPNV